MNHNTSYTFTDLYRALDHTNSTIKKVSALTEFFEHASEDDILWTIALLSKRRPKRIISSTQLREWTVESTQIPEWLFKASYHMVGDLAETISLLQEEPESPVPFIVSDWISRLIDQRDKTDLEKKEFILSAWKSLDKDSRMLFNKLITGGLRVGVSQKLMTRALSMHTKKEEAAIAHRLMGDWSPIDTDLHQLLYSEDPKDLLSKPYPFALAYAIDKDLTDIGEPKEWAAEYKWDGIRVQVIIRDRKFFLWSRGEELISHSFPELENLVKELPDNISLDGELLAYQDNHPLTFDKLQKRLGRKKVSSKLQKEIPVHIICYDILEYKSEDIRETPFMERRKILENIIPDKHEYISTSPLIHFDTWDELAAYREDAPSKFSEGIMLKKVDSVYHYGRKKGTWWKWKVDPMTLDTVMINIQSGHGRRANLFTDLTLAVWKGDTLVPIAKAYSGLTDEEFKELSRWTRKNTLATYGPVRSVPAHHVFEIAFEGIRESKRHKSGIALRFPRILRWRKDKPVSEANTIEDAQQLLKEYQHLE